MGPLKDLKVIDMTRVLAGPFCTMMLADMGAEVIKIERQETGDDSRAFGPHQNGESAYFMSINRGKKSLTLNLKSEQGKEIFLRLVKDADILVENFKPGVMNKLGFGYEDLAKINPKLIYCAASGFGHTGPYSSRPAYDLIIQGMGGLMSITGPNAQHPTKVGSSIADIFAGVFACIGILGALHNRDKTGKGQMIDVAMLDCMVAILENAVARFTSTDVDPEPIGNRHPSISPFTSLQTSDGFINVACGNDLLWKKFCEVVGLPELAQDERFSTNALRCENFDALVELVSKPVEQNTSEYWLEKLQKAHVPAGPINKISEVLADPQVLARNMLVELMHPVAGKIKVPGTPIKFSDSTALIDHPAPTLGQHNDEILMQAGYSSREIQDFKEQSVI